MNLSKMKFLTLLSTLLLQADVWAQAAAPAAGQPDMMKSVLVNLPPILALFALFYFGVIRPQRRQAKNQEELLKKIGKGDEIVTNAGIIGKITGLTEKVVTLEVDQGTEIKVLRTQIQGYFKEAMAVTASK